MDRYNTNQPKLYGIDEIRALCGGSLKGLSKLLEVREDGSIWWALSQAERDDMDDTDPELEVVSRHPNGRPSIEPLLPAKFTAVQFVDLELLVPQFAWQYIDAEVTYRVDPEDDQEDQRRRPIAVVWKGLKDPAVDVLRKRSSHAPELVEALLARLRGGQDHAPLPGQPRVGPTDARAAWRALVRTHIATMDTQSKRGKASVEEIVRFLLRLPGTGLLRGPSTDEPLEWRDLAGNPLRVTRKTIQNEAAEARRPFSFPSRLPSFPPSFPYRPERLTLP
ncbi:MAG: hypothetical protein HS106_03230 [Ideonella sp.]|nr:hypothetical protein [Ideonella sp.]MBE7425071.1 hypothetical protein [Ideonella sp.]